MYSLHRWAYFEAFRRLLKGLMWDIAALGFLGAALFLTGALFSYSPYDPSWNVAVDASVHNWCGSWGALVADVLFQGVGLGAFGFPAMALWSFFSLTYEKRLRGWGRWILGIVMLSYLQAVLRLGSYPNALPEVIGYVLGRFIPMQELRWLIPLGVISGGMGILAWPVARIIYQKLQTRKIHSHSLTEEPYNPEEEPLPEDVRVSPSPLKRSSVKKAHQPIALGQGLDLSLPPLELLMDHRDQRSERLSRKDQEEAMARLQEVLEDFGVKGRVIKAHPGPIVTLYELEPAAGVKSARVISLADDIARSLSALSARVAVIPGKNVIGIELSNSYRETVYLKELLASKEYNDFQGSLALTLGKDIGGGVVIADLTKMPHLLVAGTTGSGKSVGINSMILSLLYQLSPAQCKLIMIDPKMLELSVYDGIPHLLTPVVTEPKKAIMTLKWVVQEMEHRYRLISQLGVRNITGYNQRIQQAKKNQQPITRQVQVGFDDEKRPLFENQALYLEPLPYIVVVVDEMADLMLVAGKELEVLVQRLAQMARAAGIHLIMATQRPSVDVITGTIKANFPTRISFQVTSKIDSRTILGEQGAEHLLGQGDMLYMAAGGRIIRVHGPFVSDGEIENIVNFLKSRGEPQYVDMTLSEGDADSLDEEGEEGDSLYRQAVEIIRRDRRVSTSYLQRRLQIGYNRAASLIEHMEEEGVISPPSATGKRDIL